ncbi:putative Blue (type 1) copper binding protein [Rosa chinensis]|uniref:Putative Blue (Type 1) copper binding protein n=1 Tax=Rosa chinensis TaxID=74649 RepID=A0A2P6RW46_ROSCH|nr:umecyanin [Rosa chinensis]PRQ50647.1 putative Blue (type 1) copper binding protein [Rosa chinensis]
MENQKKMMVVFGLLAAVFLESVAAQTAHVVGGSVGWTIPQNGAQEYVTWASGQKFIVGDVLTFNFATDAHDVVQVPKASFDSCSSANPIGSTFTTGPANITLTSAGNHYYICTFGRHCQSGQKLAITVSASATSPGASPSAPTPIPPPPPTTTTTPTTPSPTSDAPCPPVQAPSPSTKTTGPTASTTPGSTVLPPSSSSPAVGAGFVLCLLSLVMGLFF